MTGVPATPRRTRQRVIKLVAAAAVLALAAWVVAARTSGPPDPGIQTSGAGTVQQISPDERPTVEPFAAETLAGDTLDTSTLSGVVVYNVWGSWCAPCRTEAPALARVARERSEDVTFVGINVRDSPSAARAFERRYDVPYDSVTSADSSQALLSFGGAAAAAGVPSTYVVDPQGRMAARLIGETTYRTLREVVDDVRAEQPSPWG